MTYVADDSKLISWYCQLLYLVTYLDTVAIWTSTILTMLSWFCLLITHTPLCADPEMPGIRNYSIWSNTQCLPQQMFEIRVSVIRIHPQLQTPAHLICLSISSFRHLYMRIKKTVTHWGKWNTHITAHKNFFKSWIPFTNAPADQTNNSTIYSILAGDWRIHMQRGVMPINDFPGKQ